MLGGVVVQMEQQLHLNTQHILVRLVFTLIELSILEFMRIGSFTKNEENILKNHGNISL